MKRGGREVARRGRNEREVGRVRERECDCGRGKEWERVKMRESESEGDEREGVLNEPRRMKIQGKKL